MAREKNCTKFVSVEALVNDSNVKEVNISNLKNLLISLFFRSSHPNRRGPS